MDTNNDDDSGRITNSDKIGEDESTHTSNPLSTLPDICFMCRTPMTGTSRLTMDALSTIVTKISVREKMEHETGCELSSSKELPRGICSGCYQVVNEIDVLEHRLSYYRNYLSASVHASMSGLTKNSEKELKNEMTGSKGNKNQSDSALEENISSAKEVVTKSEKCLPKSCNSVDAVRDTHTASINSCSISLESSNLSPSISSTIRIPQHSPIPLTSKANTTQIANSNILTAATSGSETIAKQTKNISNSCVNLAISSSSAATVSLSDNVPVHHATPVASAVSSPTQTHQSPKLYPLSPLQNYFTLTMPPHSSPYYNPYLQQTPCNLSVASLQSSFQPNILQNKDLVLENQEIIEKHFTPLFTKSEESKNRNMQSKKDLKQSNEFVDSELAKSMLKSVEDSSCLENVISTTEITRSNIDKLLNSNTSISNTAPLPIISPLACGLPNNLSTTNLLSPDWHAQFSNTLDILDISCTYPQRSIDVITPTTDIPVSTKDISPAKNRNTDSNITNYTPLSNDMYGKSCSGLEWNEKITSTVNDNTNHVATKNCQKDLNEGSSLLKSGNDNLFNYSRTLSTPRKNTSPIPTVVAMLSPNKNSITNNGYKESTNTCNALTETITHSFPIIDNKETDLINRNRDNTLFELENKLFCFPNTKSPCYNTFENTLLPKNYSEITSFENIHSNVNKNGETNDFSSEISAQSAGTVGETSNNTEIPVGKSKMIFKRKIKNKRKILKKKSGKIRNDNTAHKRMTRSQTKKLAECPSDTSNIDSEKCISNKCLKKKSIKSQKYNLRSKNSPLKPNILIDGNRVIAHTKSDDATGSKVDHLEICKFDSHQTESTSLPKDARLLKNDHQTKCKVNNEAVNNQIITPKAETNMKSNNRSICNNSIPTKMTNPQLVSQYSDSNNAQISDNSCTNTPFNSCEMRDKNRISSHPIDFAKKCVSEEILPNKDPSNSSGNLFDKQYSNTCNYGSNYNESYPSNSSNFYYNNSSRSHNTVQNSYECTDFQNLNQETINKIPYSNSVGCYISKESNNSAVAGGHSSIPNCSLEKNMVVSQQNESKYNNQNKTLHNSFSYNNKNYDIQSTSKWSNCNQNYIAPQHQQAQLMPFPKDNFYVNSDNMNNLNTNASSYSTAPNINNISSQTQYDYATYHGRSNHNPSMDTQNNLNPKFDQRRKVSQNSGNNNMNKKDVAINKIFNKNYVHSYSFQPEYQNSYGCSRQSRKATEDNRQNNLPNDTQNREMPNYSNKNNHMYSYPSNSANMTNSKTNTSAQLDSDSKSLQKTNYHSREVLPASNNCSELNSAMNSQSYSNTNYPTMQTCNQFPESSVMTATVNHERSYPISNIPNNCTTNTFNNQVLNMGNNMMAPHQSSSYPKQEMIGSNSNTNMNAINASNHYHINNGGMNRNFSHRMHNVSSRNSNFVEGISQTSIDPNICPTNNNIQNINLHINNHSVMDYNTSGGSIQESSARNNSMNIDSNRHLSKITSAPIYNSQNQALNMNNYNRRQILPNNQSNVFMNSTANTGHAPLHLVPNQYNNMQAMNNMSELNHVNPHAISYQDPNQCNLYTDQVMQYNSNPGAVYMTQDFSDLNCMQTNSVQIFNEYQKSSKNQTQTMNYVQDSCNLNTNQLYQDIPSSVYGEASNQNNQVKMNYLPVASNNQITKNSSEERNTSKVRSHQQDHNQAVNMQRDFNYSKTQSSDLLAGKLPTSSNYDKASSSCSTSMQCDSSSNLNISQYCDSLNENNTPVQYNSLKSEVTFASNVNENITSGNQNMIKKETQNLAINDERSHSVLSSSSKVPVGVPLSVTSMNNEECIQPRNEPNQIDEANNLQLNSSIEGNLTLDCILESNKNTPSITKTNGDVDIDIEKCDISEDTNIRNSEKNLDNFQHEIEQIQSVSETSSNCLDNPDDDSDISSDDGEDDNVGEDDVNEFEDNDNEGIDDDNEGVDDDNEGVESVAQSFTDTHTEVLSIAGSGLGEVYNESDISAYPSVAPSPALENENISSVPSPVPSTASFNRPLTPDVIRNGQEATEYLKPTLLARHVKTKKHAKLQTCRQCDQVFSTRQNLVRHVGEKHRASNFSYSCGVCNKKFHTEKNLTKHKQQHEIHKCKLCSETFPRKSHLRNHVKEHIQQGLYCSQCNFECNSVQALISHMSSHQREKPVHKCNICEKVFANKRNLIVHNRKHTGEKPHVCSNCDRRFSVKSNMVAHRDLCMGVCKFKCDVCTREFPLISVYIKHMAEHEGNFPHSCKFCNKGFTKPSGLKEHLKTHQKKKNYTCTGCNISFLNSSQLKIHMRTHYNKSARQVTCMLCFKTLARAELLADHFARHSNVRNHVCSHCDRAFFYKCNLKSHIKVMHMGIKSHKCPHCSKGFSSKYNLNIHLSVHSGVKPHECMECGKKFSTKPNLAKHQKCHVTSNRSESSN